MDKFKAIIGQIIKFDKDRFSFDEIFLARINEYFSTKENPVSDLSLLHETVDESSVDDIYEELYKFVSKEHFQTLYKKFVEEIAISHLSTSVLYQKIPGIRLHFPGIKTVQYHTDEWYGHGPEVLNFWMPLTDVFSSNALFVASLEDSLREVSRLEKEKATIDVINEDLSKITHPLELNFGQIYVFSAKSVHGAEINLTERTRISIDFRFLPVGGNPGLKSISGFYSSLNQENSEENRIFSIKKQFVTCIYIFCGYGYTQYISHFNQRLICIEYAKRHNISIYGDETEIRTMGHHPMLLGLASGDMIRNIDSIILFSVFCMPQSINDRNRIYNASIRNSITLFFANEDMVVAKNSDIENVENMWQQVGHWSEPLRLDSLRGQVRMPGGKEKGSHHGRSKAFEEDPLDDQSY